MVRRKQSGVRKLPDGVPQSPHEAFFGVVWGRPWLIWISLSAIVLFAGWKALPEPFQLKVLGAGHSAPPEKASDETRPVVNIIQVTTYETTIDGAVTFEPGRHVEVEASSPAELHSQEANTGSATDLVGFFATLHPLDGNPRNSAFHSQVKYELSFEVIRRSLKSNTFEFGVDLRSQAVTGTCVTHPFALRRSPTDNIAIMAIDISGAPLNELHIIDAEFSAPFQGWRARSGFAEVAVANVFEWITLRVNLRDSTPATRSWAFKYDSSKPEAPPISLLDGELLGEKDVSFFAESRFFAVRIDGPIPGCRYVLAWDSN